MSLEKPAYYISREGRNDHPLRVWKADAYSYSYVHGHSKKSKIDTGVMTDKLRRWAPLWLKVTSLYVFLSTKQELPRL